MSKIKNWAGETMGEDGYDYGGEVTKNKRDIDRVIYGKKGKK